MISSDDEFMSGLGFESEELAVRAAQVMNREHLHADLRKLLSEFGLQNILTGLVDLLWQGMNSENKEQYEQALLDLEVLRSQPHIQKASLPFETLKPERLSRV